MALTDTDIGNMALAHIGYSSSQISDLDEDSPEAVEIKFWFSIKRDELLEMWPWEVAKKWAALALVSDDIEHPDYQYSYRMPPDCVFGQELYQVDGVGTIISEGKLPYTTAEDDQGKLVMCNYEQVGLKYTGRRTNTAYWSMAFCNALAWFIAIDITLPLAKDVSYQSNAEQHFENANKQAQANSVNEVTDEPPAQSSAISSRQGYSGYDRRDIWYE